MRINFDQLYWLSKHLQDKSNWTTTMKYIHYTRFLFGVVVGFILGLIF